MSKELDDFIIFIVENDKNGRAVLSSIDGFEVKPVEELVNQPVDGILYDLNILEEVCLTRIKDPDGIQWVNKHATALVIRELKKQVDNLNKVIYNMTYPTDPKNLMGD